MQRAWPRYWKSAIPIFPASDAIAPVRTIIGPVIAILGSAALIYSGIAILAWFYQDRLIYPASQNRVEPVGGYSATMLTTSDGLKLRAFYKKPATGRPTIVYFHGNGGTLAGSMMANAQFAQAGYGLLLVNYRGYGGNPGVPSERGFYRDGNAAMAWLAQQGVTPSDIVVAGNSIGGGTAVEMAVVHSPHALMLTAPFTSLTDVAAEKAGWLPVRWLLRDRFDNAAKIGKLSMPVLIQHGC